MQQIKQIATVCAGALVLGACSSPQITQQQAGGFQNWRCGTGAAAWDVRVRSLSVDQTEVQLWGRRVVLTRAVSASGERYVNAKGFNNAATEWHQKGGEAMLIHVSQAGVQEETVCSIAAAQ